jgi:hypothetical protein
MLGESQLSTNSDVSPYLLWLHLFSFSHEDLSILSFIPHICFHPGFQPPTVAPHTTSPSQPRPALLTSTLHCSYLHCSSYCKHGQGQRAYYVYIGTESPAFPGLPEIPPDPW